jgi:2-iminobutanoate/2-iminopropanoate deaminase
MMRPYLQDFFESESAQVIIHDRQFLLLLKEYEEPFMKEKIEASTAPKAIGPYSQALRDSDTGLVFLSGQIAIDPATGNFLNDTIEVQTKQVMENLKAVLEAAGLDFSHLLKTTIYLTDLKDFSLVNDLYGAYLSRPYPARATVEVKALPRGAKVEIEAIAKGR